MTIAASNLAALATGDNLPDRSGGFFEGPSMNRLACTAQVTITGDGSAVSAVINMVDGTKVLPFTPSAVTVARIGGSNTALTQGVITSFDTTKATVKWTTAPVTATTEILLVNIYR